MMELFYIVNLANPITQKILYKETFNGSSFIELKGIYECKVMDSFAVCFLFTILIKINKEDACKDSRKFFF